MEDVREWIESNTFRGGSGRGFGPGWGFGPGDGDGSSRGFASGSGFGDGFGYGRGFGSGDGSSDGLGYGSGYGSGSGDIYGSGSGSGFGSGDGLKTFNGMDIYNIDSFPTVIRSAALNLAKGFVLFQDLTLSPCYIVKEEGCFAHGKTLNEAREALHDKIMRRMGTEKTIEKFLESYKKGEKYPGADFFKWHHYLTGSCLMGRESFVRDNGLSLDSEYTVEEFISLCEDAYGGEIIKKLKERYENE